MKKKELIEKSEKQFDFIEQQIKDLQKDLRVLRQKGYRKRDLTKLGMFELTQTLNRVKGILYSANHHTNSFLGETGKLS